MLVFIYISVPQRYIWNQEILWENLCKKMHINCAKWETVQHTVSRGCNKLCGTVWNITRQPSVGGEKMCTTNMQQGGAHVRKYAHVRERGGGSCKTSSHISPRLPTDGPACLQGPPHNHFHNFLPSGSSTSGEKNSLGKYTEFHFESSLLISAP